MLVHQSHQIAPHPSTVRKTLVEKLDPCYLFIHCKLKFLMAIAGLFLVGTQASEINNTKISRTMMDSNRGAVIFVQVEGTPSRANGSCHSNGTWDYVLPTDTEFGRQMLSRVLAAHAFNKTVRIRGNDDCLLGSVEVMTRLELY